MGTLRAAATRDMTDPSAIAPAGRAPRPSPVATSIEGVARCGVIVLARHGEPALSRKIKLDARAYDRWWATYEAGGILPGQTPPDALVQAARDADLILCSTRARAIQTAEVIAPGRSFSTDPMFVEAPLPAPSTPSWFRIGPKWWGVVSRLLWWCGRSGGQETRREAQGRAKRAAQRLIAEAEAGRDVLVVAHGFFNSMMGLELTRAGWRCTRDRGFKYWSTRRFEREDG